MTASSRPSGIVLVWLALLAAPGCYTSHELDRTSPGDDASVSDTGVSDLGVSDLGLRDAAVLRDGDVVDANVVDANVVDASMNGNDAGMTPCVRDFVVRTLSIPTLASGVGFDLDGGGTQLGCGVDGPNGVDNGLATLVDYASEEGVDLDRLFIAATAAGLISRPVFRLDQCRTVPTFRLVGGIGRSRPAVVETDSSGSITFRATVEELPIFLQLVGFHPDFTLDEARVSGTITGNTISSLVIGGTISRERVETLAREFARLTSMPRDDVEAAFLELLDLDPDPDTGACEDLSAAFQATGTFLQP